MNEIEFCSELDIDVTIVEVWIAEGWLRPEMAAGERAFRLADVARARLILDLGRRMGVNDAGIDVVMELVDQIHGLRGAVSAVITAISSQDEQTRSRLALSLNRVPAVGR